MHLKTSIVHLIDWIIIHVAKVSSEENKITSGEEQLFILVLRRNVVLEHESFIIKTRKTN